MNSPISIDSVIKRSSELRQICLQIAKSAGSKAAHIGGALSCIDFICVADMYYQLSKSKDDLNRFVLSKGHACLSLYSLIADAKLIDKSIIIETFESDNSKFLGHPCKDSHLGILFSTGSLGNGLPHAIGQALYYSKINKQSIDSRVVCVMGDGECNEGIVWESLEFLSQLGIDNLVIFIDCNSYQQTQPSIYSLDQYRSFYERIRTFSFDSYLIDGHNHAEILHTLMEPSSKSKVILGLTHKGKGYPLFESDNKWHHNIITESIYQQITQTN